MKRIGYILLCALLFSTPSYAQDLSDGSLIKYQCIKDDSPDSDLFPEIQAAARKLDEEICNAIIVPTRRSVTDGFPRDAVTAFGVLVKQRVSSKLGNLGLQNLDKQLSYLEKKLATGDNYPVAMPRFNVKKGISGPRDVKFDYFFSGNFENSGTLTAAQNEQCVTIDSLAMQCSEVLIQLDNAIFPYQRNANAVIAYDTRIRLSALAKEWDAYFEGARAQTFADIALTTFFERNHFKKNYLVGPPQRQWFVLHPNIVLEQVDGAPDGEKLKPALSLEWIGVNWWKNSIIRIPLGISLTSVYSDRPEVDDIGHGIAFHLDNKYTIGYSYRGGDNGFYISMDFLKLIEDRQEQAERFRKDVKDLIE